MDYLFVYKLIHIIIHIFTKNNKINDYVVYIFFILSFLTIFYFTIFYFLFSETET